MLLMECCPTISSEPLHARLVMDGAIAADQKLAVFAAGEHSLDEELIVGDKDNATLKAT